MIYLNKHDFYFLSDSDSDEFFCHDSQLQSPSLVSFDPDTTLTSTDSHSLDSTKSSILSSPLSKSGWLQKQADNLLKTWQWRYFSLSSHKLEYFYKESDSIPSGIINFSQVDAKLSLTPAKAPNRLKVSVTGLRYSFNLKSDSSKDLQEWAQVIQHSIDQCKGKIKELPLLTLGEKFWKFERISNYYFETNASTGDILLFRSNGLASKIQRGITGSKYDHVALVLCYASGRIVLFEATQEMGVSLTDWGEFLENRWNELYEGIGYRSLEFERTDENLLRLDEFVSKSKGKAYGLNPKKILLNGSFRLPGDEKDFFCSELVASAYKALGVISEKVPSNSFLPGNFADDKSLGLVGARLGAIKLINFEL